MSDFQENDIVQALRNPIPGARISALEYCVRYRVVEVDQHAGGVAGNTVLGIRPVELDDDDHATPEAMAMGTLAIGNPGLYLEKVEAKPKGPSWIRDLREARKTQERHVEALRQGIRDLAGYLCSSKFEVDPTVQVRDVLTRLQEIEAAGLATEYPDGGCECGEAYDRRPVAHPKCRYCLGL